MSKVSVTSKNVFKLALDVKKSMNHGISYLSKLPIYDEIKVLVDDTLALYKSTITVNSFPEDVLSIGEKPIFTLVDNSPDRKQLFSAIVQTAEADGEYDFSHFSEERLLLAFYITSLFLCSSDTNLKNAYEIKKLPGALYRYFLLVTADANETKDIVSKFMKFCYSLKFKGTNHLKEGDTFFCPHRFLVVSGTISAVCGRVLGLQSSATFNSYSQGKWSRAGFYKPAKVGNVIVSNPWSDPYWSIITGYR